MANNEAYFILKNNGTALDAVEQGCIQCENMNCDDSVGMGGYCDDTGETTLDAMLMDGNTFNVGAVGGIKRIKHAISVARLVLERTTHSFLVGESATSFANSMGVPSQDLHTANSIKIQQDWKENNCQPNSWKNVTPDPKKSCGPYKPIDSTSSTKQHDAIDWSLTGHDTISMIAMDMTKHIFGATSTNGYNHKIPGRVGDSPIAGSGVYVDSEIGGAGATGDGDIMMRFSPSVLVVELIAKGVAPAEACSTIIRRIAKYYPNFNGALYAVTKTGEHGAACNGFGKFPYWFSDNNMQQLFSVDCLSL